MLQHAAFARAVPSSQVVSRFSKRIDRRRWILEASQYGTACHKHVTRPKLLLFQRRVLCGMFLRRHIRPQSERARGFGAWIARASPLDPNRQEPGGADDQIDADINHEARVQTEDIPEGPAVQLPSAYAILFGLICVVSAATWVIPAGSFTRELSAALGKEVPIPGTYHAVQSAPQGLVAAVLAPVLGLYATVDVAAFLFMIGGFLAVVNRTGALDAGVQRVVARLKGREIWMIPILMFIFALGGTSWGLAEETIPFYGILAPVMISAGFDALTAVATILIGAGVGVLGSTLNPFATVIASDAAGVSIVAGMPVRAGLLLVGFAVAAAHVAQYAARVRKDPSASFVAELAEEHRAHFLGTKEAQPGASERG